MIIVLLFVDNLIYEKIEQLDFDGNDFFEINYT